MDGLYKATRLYVNNFSVTKFEEVRALACMIVIEIERKR
jgi:hypothetical protein